MTHHDIVRVTPGAPISGGSGKNEGAETPSSSGFRQHAGHTPAVVNGEIDRGQMPVFDEDSPPGPRRTSVVSFGGVEHFEDLENF